ncbi:MAG: thioredoxin [Acidimicrobiales bacterium]
MSTGEITCPDCETRNRVPLVTSGKPRCASCHNDLPWLSEVTTADFDPIIERSSLPVLVDLWAPWCGPCRTIAPALAELSVERAGSLRVVKVNVDQEPQVSARLRVQGIPTMVLFRDGVEAGRQVGAIPLDRIRGWIDTTLRTAAT